MARGGQKLGKTYDWISFVRQRAGYQTELEPAAFLQLLDDVTLADFATACYNANCKDFALRLDPNIRGKLLAGRRNMSLSTLTNANLVLLNALEKILAKSVPEQPSRAYWELVALQLSQLPEFRGRIDSETVEDIKAYHPLPPQAARAFVAKYCQLRDSTAGRLMDACSAVGCEQAAAKLAEAL